MSKIIYLDTAKDKTTNPKNEFVKIIKTFFDVSNKILLINMFNFLYNDNIPQDSQVSLLNSNEYSNSYNNFIRIDPMLPNLIFSIKNKSLNNIYELEFKDNMYEKFTITISKFDSNNYSKKKCINLNVPNIIIVSFEKDLKESDKFPLIININNHKFNYNIPYFRSWKLTLTELCQSNLFLFLPLRFLLLKSFIFTPWKCNAVINEINRQLDDIYLDINLSLKSSLNMHALTYNEFDSLMNYAITMKNFVAQFLDTTS